MSKNTRNRKPTNPANPSAEEVTNPAAIVSAPQESVQTGENTPTVEPVPTQDETTEDYSEGERVTPEQTTTEEGTTSTEGTEEGTTSTEGTEEGTTSTEEGTTSTEEKTTTTPAHVTMTTTEMIQAALTGQISAGTKTRASKQPADPNAYTRLWMTQTPKGQGMSKDETRLANRVVTFEGVKMTAYKVPIIKAIREWAAAHANPKIQAIAQASTAQFLLWIDRKFVVTKIISVILKDMKIDESEALKTA